MPLESDVLHRTKGTELKCQKCLFKLISGEVFVDIYEAVRPLRFIRPKLYGLTKAYKDDYDLFYA